MNSISFYLNDGDIRDLAAFISEVLLPLGYNFSWSVENGQIEIYCTAYQANSLALDAKTYNLSTEEAY